MDTSTENPLGQFLRALRELLRPEDVGVVARGRRRVVGLRREEVAQLAGVSTDYYVRLEQGRERHPSVQVVEALDGEAAAHLHGLALPSSGRRRRPAPPRRDTVSPHLLRMMAAWPHRPPWSWTAVCACWRPTLWEGLSSTVTPTVTICCGWCSSTRTRGTSIRTGTAWRRRRPRGQIAGAISYAIGQPNDVDVNELVIRPTRQR